jgi:hypothetical protein
MNIRVVSKSMDNGVAVTREREVAIYDVGAFVRYAIDKKDGPAGKAIKEAARALKVPYRRLREMLVEAVLDVLSTQELVVEREVVYDSTVIDAETGE